MQIQRSVAALAEADREERVAVHASSRQFRGRGWWVDGIRKKR